MKRNIEAMFDTLKFAAKYWSETPEEMHMKGSLVEALFLTVDGEIQRLSGEIRSLDASHQNKQNEQIEILHEDYQKRIDILEEENQKLRVENEDWSIQLKDQEDFLIMIQTQKEMLEEKNVAIEQQAERIQEIMQQRDQQWEMTKSLQKEISKLKNDNQYLLNQKSNESQDLNEYKIFEEEYNDLKGSYSMLEEGNNTLTQENARLKKTIEQLYIRLNKKTLA